ncbi:MAG: hypothetical protein LC104_08390 [Bacteroidales bacterium]|nr:hypothetical protein [Bacteroidales bacterium]
MVASQTTPMPMNSTPPNWTAFSSQLAALSRPVLAGVAVRAARRAAPAILTGAAPDDSEPLEWCHAAVSTITLIETWARGNPVSDFVLMLASEFPRLAAQALAAANRKHGPSPHTERMETALAAAAFAADLIRASTPDRARSVALQALTNADAAVPGIGRLAEFDTQTALALGIHASEVMDASETGPLGELWPMGEPEEWTAAWARLEQANLPRLVVFR